MSLIVQKFGGTSVADLERIRHVAKRVVTTYNQENDVVVILSAMSGITDNLIDMARKVTETPDGRELDVLLATGEQTTSALLAMMLKSMGYPAQSLLGHQAEVVTDYCHGNARIVDIRADRIKKLLKERHIVVIAGFQGCDPDGNITTLGRGGSDTSAVAIAAAIKADVCEIFTDVDGIYTADPNICQKARKLSSITYDEMLNMGFKEDIDSILSYTLSDRVTWLFSATMPPEIRKIVKKINHNSQILNVRELQSGSYNLQVMARYNKIVNRKKFYTRVSTFKIPINNYIFIIKDWSHVHIL